MNVDKAAFEYTFGLGIFFLLFKNEFDGEMSHKEYLIIAISISVIGIICCVSTFVTICQSTIERARCKRGYLYPWIAYSWIWNMVAIGCAIWMFVRFGFRWEIIVVSLLNIMYFTWCGLLGISYFQFINEIPFDHDEVGIIRSEMF